MKRRLFVFMLGCAFAAPLAANAEVTDPLLRKLVDKGTLSATEAEEVQSKKVELPAALKGLSVSGIAFFDFSAGQSASGASAKTDFSRFTLQRGYLNIVKEITPWMRARMTTDIKSGTTVTGDYTVRMKYLYADFLTPDMGPLTNTDIRAGLGHTTYLDFEESINGYRMQGSMFEDKRGLITSSDLGVSVQGYLAGKLSKEQTAEVGSGSYAGRYDSFDPNKDASDDRITTTIGGVSYRITGQNYIVAAYEKTHDETKAYDDKKGQVVLQVAF